MRLAHGLGKFMQMGDSARVCGAWHCRHTSPLFEASGVLAVLRCGIALA
jgi:hypothetical protein